MHYNNKICKFNFVIFPESSFRKIAKSENSQRRWMFGHKKVKNSKPYPIKFGRLFRVIFYIITISTRIYQGLSQKCTANYLGFPWNCVSRAKGKFRIWTFRQNLD